MTIGWLTRIVVGMSIVGVLGFDGVSMAAAYFGAPDDADNAARAAAASWQQSHSPALAEQAAEGAMTTTEALVPQSFSVAANGTIHLRMKRVPRTLVARDLPYVRNWRVTTVTGSAAPVTP